MPMLEVVHLGRLLAGDEQEQNRLLHALSTQGLFFLDLRETPVEAALQPQQLIIPAQRSFFNQDLPAKLPYTTQSDHDGFQYCEELSVQTLKLSRRQQVEGSLALPASLQPVETAIFDVAAVMDGVLRELTLQICGFLQPPIVPAAAQNPSDPGLSNLCLGLAAATPGTELMERHVDSDILTMTCYTEPFLEVPHPVTAEWTVVDVFGDMPIVNVGMSLQKLSGNRFRAPLHGVRQSQEVINLIMYDLHDGTATTALLSMG